MNKLLPVAPLELILPGTVPTEALFLVLRLFLKGDGETGSCKLAFLVAIFLLKVGDWLRPAGLFELMTK